MHPSAIACLIFLVCGPWQVLGSSASACSALMVQLAGRPIMARNYDWHLGHAMAMLNQPGIRKRALSFDNPVEWTSKYGSFTINQYGRELPCDGMNEAGLAISVLWLTDTVYPTTDERPSVNAAQWVQYQLDTAATVADVVASDNRVRITPYGGAKVHYFLVDASGDCAVVEFLDGRMVVHRGEQLRPTQITNNSCESSAAYLATCRHDGDAALTPAGNDSLSRYVRLASVANELSGTEQSPHKAALAAIDQVRQHSTRWQIVYDPREHVVHFRTYQHRPLRQVDLEKCRFDVEAPVEVLDLNAPLSGEVSAEFARYTREANRRLVQRSIAGSEFLRNLPSTVVQFVIDYPELSCHALRPTEAVTR